ncbi:hypothetical protein Megpolyxen_01381 [Candidatus Megaera polyxenophila]|nr:hypothetical protein Megpolyxen_01381 [Candidatus Megaera polyxenophila]
MKVILNIVFFGCIVGIASFILNSDRMPKMNVHVKWVIAISLIIVGLLVKEYIYLSIA